MVTLCTRDKAIYAFVMIITKQTNKIKEVKKVLYRVYLKIDIYLIFWLGVHCRITNDYKYLIFWLSVHCRITNDYKYLIFWLSVHCRITNDYKYLIFWLSVNCRITNDYKYLIFWLSVHCRITNDYKYLIFWLSVNCRIINASIHHLYNYEICMNVYCCLLLSLFCQM